MPPELASDRRQTAESENLFPDCENQVGINNTGTVYYDTVRFFDTETRRADVG